ncbi:hypothetical protein T4A_9730 [Trichinella pseudospiralis]|uniref:Uncharacterized protein n=1 Tax=Trichinella pseudospiralis TaxID=6337 RepID=A0A0V1EJA2_TRIPS|nr:hypothetical protein T4A_9730 [Trichinella pseudospiralis]
MEEHDHLKGLKFADQFPRGEVEIDLLIRIDHYYNIVLNEIKRVDTSKPTAVKTIFGWVQIPNNYEQAERRLQQLEKKLINNDKRAKEYDEVIKNYIEGGWIGETDVRDGIPGKTWYLPHHAVYRDDKTTTRCRIVFDASAKYHGTSLNDFLDPGPPLQNQILDILI